MITVSQTKTILAFLSSLYRHAFQDMSAGDVELMAKIWQKKLSPYEFEEVERATDYITSRSKFMPAIAEIIEVIEQNRRPELKASALEAWSNVINAVRRYGYYDFQSAKKHLSERELELVNRISWNRLCTADYREMDFIKKDFIAMFDAGKDEEMQELIDNRNQYIKFVNNKTMQIGGGGCIMESTRYFKTIQVMLERGYFHTKEEYEKAKTWIIKGVIPEWFKKDMKEYEESEEQNANSLKKQNGEGADQERV